ncbi:MAG TPA: hypothetical protein VJ964_06570 [Balneolaceae bacterium]|nr:hypothetical protein [Balneolaceae bacterium]
MKKVPILSATSLCLLLILGISSVSTAQLRKNEGKPSDLMGPVTKTNQVDRSRGANLGNLFNMTMDQSYSMMFSSFGGQLQNLNVYTNTMHFFFSPKLTGRVDLSVLHSPFGNSFLSNGKSNGLDARFMVQNAELDYQISDKSSISIHFQQLPSYGYGYGMSPWSNGYYRGPFGSPFQDRNF